MTAEEATQRPAGGAYYTTSFAFGAGTTNSIGLTILRALSHHLVAYRLPMTGEQLTSETGLSIEQIDAIFRQNYYQRHYGFRRFLTLEEWHAWAESSGVLHVPGLHDDPDDEEPEDEEEYEEDEEQIAQ